MVWLRIFEALFLVASGGVSVSQLFYGRNKILALSALLVCVVLLSFSYREIASSLVSLASSPAPSFGTNTQPSTPTMTIDGPDSKATWQAWYSIVFSPMNAIFALGKRKTEVVGTPEPKSRGPDVEIWDATERKLLKSFSIGGAWAGVALAFSPDGQTIAAGGARHESVKLFDIQTATLMRNFAEHPDGPCPETNSDGDCLDFVTSVAFSRDGQILAAGSYHGDIRLWNVKSGRLLRTLNKGVNSIVSLAFSPDGATLGTASAEGIFLWSVQTGALTRTLLTGKNLWPKSIAFSSDAHTIALGGNDFDSAVTTWLWVATTGAPLRTYADPNGSVDSVAFSPDSTTLAAAGGDIRLYDMSTGQFLRKISCLADREFASQGAISAAFSSDGSYLGLVCNDGTVKIYDVRDIAGPFPRPARLF